MDERDDWVADVRRWCMNNRPDAVLVKTVAFQRESSELDHDAARTVPPSRRWTEAPRSEFGTLG